MFLLLCLPQLLDWRHNRPTDYIATTLEQLLLISLLSALWLNGNADGHTAFLLLPQMINWFLFFGLMTVLLTFFLKNLAYIAAQMNFLGSRQ